MDRMPDDEYRRMDPESREMYNDVNQEEAETRKREEWEKLQRLGLSFARERARYIDARAASGVEGRWREDLYYYHGRDEANRQQTQEMMDNLGSTGRNVAGRADEKPSRSRIFINITRPKTNSAEARLADMLFPLDERNWGIKPTPVPELTKAMQEQTTPLLNPQTGQQMQVEDTESGERRPATVADAARIEMDKAVEAAKAMEREIDDQLTECEYNWHSREAIRSAARLGTGVLKGPVVITKRAKSWTPVTDGQSTAYVIEMIEKQVPESYCVDLWDFYPDMACGTDIRNAEAIWERKRVTARKLRQLAKTPGYLAEAIVQVLDEGPQKAHETRLDSRNFNPESREPVEDDARYELWERHGDIPVDVLQACGCDTSQMDPLETVTGCVVLVNQTVIKAYAAALDTEDLIYDVFAWEPSEENVFGYGLPYLLRQCSQRMLNAAGRQMMDNAGASAGPQIVVRRNAVTPADGRHEVRGLKLWYATDETISVKDVFAAHNVPSNVLEYKAIIEMALKFADEEVSFPMIMAGERGTAPEQVGSMQMLMNAATVVLRRIVKRYDDRVTRRHIGRYYDWNMQYNEKGEVKGDFEVDARGSTTLVQRDLQNQAIQKWLQALVNPSIGYMFDKLKMVRKGLQADYLTPDDVLKPEEEIKRTETKMAQTPPAPTPDAKVRAEATVAAAQAAAESRVRVAEIGAQDSDAERQSRQNNEERKLQLDAVRTALDNDLELKRLLQSSGMDSKKIKARLAEVMVNNQQKRDLFLAERALKLKMGSGI